jgi:hypothetical protein
MSCENKKGEEWSEALIVPLTPRQWCERGGSGNAVKVSTMVRTDHVEELGESGSFRGGESLGHGVWGG